MGMEKEGPQNSARGLSPKWEDFLASYYRNLSPLLTQQMAFREVSRECPILEKADVMDRRENSYA